MNIKQKLFVVFLDMVVLAELAASLYWSNQFGDLMTPLFLKIYLPTVLATLIIGKFCLSRLRSKEIAGETADAVASH